MKRKSFLLASAASLISSAAIASACPAVSASSENAVRIGSARVVPAIGGGSYITGLAKTSFGYSVPRAAHVHVFAYDAKGRLLAEKIDKLNSPRLVRSHRNPLPKTSYEIFVPWDTTQIAKVSIVEHSGLAHPST